MWGFSKHLLLAALGLMLSAVSAYADLGWTPAQSVQAYGKPTAGPDGEGLDETIYQFEAQGYSIYASYLYGRVGKITYHRQAALDESLINFFKAENCPNTQWHVVIEGGSGYWSGQVDGKEAYVAGLSDHHTSSVAARR
jgi:hypothetical protein